MFCESPVSPVRGWFSTVDSSEFGKLAILLCAPSSSVYIIKSHPAMGYYLIQVDICDLRFIPSLTLFRGTSEMLLKPQETSVLKLSPVVKKSCVEPKEFSAPAKILLNRIYQPQLNNLG